MSPTGVAGTAPRGRSVPAAVLLDESERRWSVDLARSLRDATDPAAPDGLRQRCRLVREALSAYEALRSDTSPGSDPHAVARRWPHCVVVSLCEVAATAPEADLDRRLPGPDPGAWVTGWAAAWELLAPTNVPVLAGVASLLRRAAGRNASPPLLRLDLDRGALVVEYPGEIRRGARVEAGGGDCPEVDGRWIVPRPVPAVTCFDLVGDVHRLSVVDIRDPLMVFDADGMGLPTGAPIPGEVWIVHRGAPAAEHAVEGAWRVLEQRPPPVGWSRWWLGRVSLADATALRSAVDDGLGARTGAWRPVATLGEADLEFGPESGTLTGADGDPVFTTAPRLRLSGGAGDLWTVEVGRAGSATTHRAGFAGGTTVPLDDVVPPPLIGRFTVRATAPGRGTVRSRFSLAVGVEVHAGDRKVRMLRPDGGLATATIRVTPPAGVRAEPPRIGLGPDDQDGRVTLSHERGSVELRVQVPYCAHRRWKAGDPGSWVVRPQTLQVSQIVSGTHLDVLVPESVRTALGSPPALVVGHVGDATALRLTGRRVGRGDIVRYSLGPVVDSVRGRVDLPLWLAIPRFAARVAIVRDVVIAGGVDHLGDRLRLTGREGGHELEVEVSTPFAPWLQPTRHELAADEDVVPLVAPFDGGATVDVVVRAPSLGRAVRLRTGDRRRPPALPTRGQADTAAYLAGIAPVPEDPHAWPWLWWAAANGGPDRAPGMNRLLAQECAEVFATAPGAALAALSRTALPAENLVCPLIRSGAAAHRLAEVRNPATVAAAWTRTPLPALLLSSPLLPYLCGAPDWDVAELDEGEASVLAATERGLTETARGVLTGARPAADLLDDQCLHGMAAVTVAIDPIVDPVALEATARLRLAEPALFDVVGELAEVDRARSELALAARLAAQGHRGAVVVAVQTRSVWLAVADAAPAAAAVALACAEILVSRHYGLPVPRPEERP